LVKKRIRSGLRLDAVIEVVDELDEERPSPSTDVSRSWKRPGLPRGVVRSGH
jgi:hypothetical protein